MSCLDKRKVVIKLGQLNKIEELRVIVENLEHSELLEICEQCIIENDINTFIHYLMKGFTETDESKEKRFNVVAGVLNCLNKQELQMKSTLDLVTRLCVDLDTLTNEQIVCLVESCLDSIRQQDSRTVYWKDFLPQLINLIFNLSGSLQANGITMSNMEYRSAIIKNITLFQWRLEILTPLAAMFKEIELTREEREQILTKLCENLFDLDPTELPGLALQLFGLCNTPSLLVIPILFFQKYFNKNYYAKEYNNMDSNTTHYDSIDPHASNPQTMQQVQETILYHLSSSTEFTLNEKDVVTVFRNIANTPHYLLTPFMISTLLTLSKVNRQPDIVRLSTSAILPFLRKVIQNNELEKEMSHHSLWCRQTFNRNTVAIDNIIMILIDQSITGLEVVTPGVVALAFTLLKAKKQPDLNLLGMNFLQKFLKKRYIFGQGILKQLSELMFANQEAAQFAECLNTLSLTNSLTISECVTTVESILEFLLLIPGQHAMRMITFIFPLIRLSVAIRDSLIAVLTKAMSSTDVQRRRFGVYGFCLLLKNLRNNTARRAVGGISVSSNNLSFTQGNISGLSLMSQSTLGNRDNPQRHFDMLALEIVGLLRKCFNETQETKEIMYEGLIRAIEFNHKLTSHLLIFIDWHFRSYFELSGGELVVKFDRIVMESEGVVDVWDNIGKLLTFVATCVIVCEEYQITHDNRIIVDLLNTNLDKVDSITVQSLGLQSDRRSREIGQQYIHLLEGVMAYAAMASSSTNNLSKKFYNVFKHHQKITAELKALFGERKSSKKVRSKELATSTPNCSTANHSSDLATTQLTINDTQKQSATEEPQFKPVNIWEASTLQKILDWVFSDATTNNPLPDLRKDVKLKVYLLTITTHQIESYRHMPDYRHVKHSGRMFSFLGNVTKLIFASIKKLSNDAEDDDVLTASLSVECFRQCLMTAESVYKRKLDEFFNQVGNGSFEGSLHHEQVLAVIETIHKLVEKSVAEEAIAVADFKKMQQNLLHCLEILYSLLPPDNSECASVASWLYDFCLNNDIAGKHLDGVFKLLFTQRLKYFDGDFFCSIAIQLSKVFGTLSEQEGEPAFELRAISPVTAEAAVLHLCSLIRKDVEDVETTVLKVRSIAAKIRFLGDRGADDDHIQSLKTMERSICAHLIHIANTLFHLTNSNIPVGTPTDTLVRLLTQYYICLNNVCKHLTARNTVVPVVYSHIKFEKLIQISGKPLAGRVYDLISYIDRNLIPQESETTARKRPISAEKTRKKVIRDTRSLPKLIRWIETLHKYVLILGKKTSKDLSGYLHMGIVRDFRIQNLHVPGEDDSAGEGENSYGMNEDDNSDAESNSTGLQELSGTAAERIFKNMAKLKKKKTVAPKPAPARGKRSRSAVVVPDVAGILSAINANLGHTSPAKKRARRSTKTA